MRPGRKDTDWPKVVKEFNRKYHCGYENDRVLLKALYKFNSSRAVAEYLGLSQRCVLMRMDRLGLPRRSPARPRMPERRRLEVKVPPSVFNDLQLLSDRMESTPNQVALTAIKKYIKAQQRLRDLREAA